MKNGRAHGSMTITLHAHLPYVVHHGTWPHGLEWLLEAAAETYLPLLRVFENLERDGLALKANLILSPVLIEQLAHPKFRAEFPEYVKRKIQAAREDEEYFRQSGDAHFVKTAQYWRSFFELAIEQFESLGGDIVRGFRHFTDSGQIEILTCCATHGYLPLLGTDESVIAQVKMGVATHERHLGRRPSGMWVPECGYRPAGIWQAPVMAHGSNTPWPAVQRMGVEEALAESGIEYFFVDAHLIEDSMMFTPYESRAAGGAVGAAAAMPRCPSGCEALYRAYIAEGPRADDRPVKVLPRDPSTGLQVWSSDTGYPGEAAYLDFHKKRWPGGHRYWQVTSAGADTADKTPYFPEQALAKTREHAEHFVSVVYRALESSLSEKHPPILSAPFDAELFGHWWHEGPAWLEQVARIVADEDFPIALATASEALERSPATGLLAMEEGSWGKNGTNEVWLNPQTAWTWSHIYPAEERVRDLVSEGRWQDGGAGERIAKQMCRELLLLESSDWQFLITTEAARDYAEGRFLTHLDQFRELERAWEEFTSTGRLSERTEERVTAIEARDNIFADIDPALWKRRG